MIRLLVVFVLLVSTAQAAIYKVRIDGVIDPITSQFFTGAVKQAEDGKAEFLLIELSTPGGLGISMQEIIQTILGCKVPVVCYVTPKGTHAASAGFFILLSADIAAMAPGTNTGAAHPVFPFGMNDKVMLEKVRNDSLANLRSIVKQRKRNYDMAEKGVLESKSYTEREALDGGLIDLIALDEADLFRQLENRQLTRFTGETQRIRTKGEQVVTIEPSLRQKFLSTLADPNIALILGLIGLLGIYLEFTHPGLILPGLAGTICLLLALLGFSLLPINAIGVALMVLAIGLFIAEVKVQGFGLLGVGGVISMVLGILFLIDAPYAGVRIGYGLAFAVALPFALILLFLLRLVVRAQRRRVTAGQTGVVGMIGEARTDITPEGGKVFVHGEWWRAASKEPIQKDSRVRVVEARNLDLLVEPHAETEADLIEESGKAKSMTGRTSAPSGRRKEAE